MEKLYNSICFSLDDYKYEEDPKKLMWEDISTQLQLLFRTGNICVIRDDDGSGSFIVIEYEHDERFDPFGGASPVWLTPEDEEFLALAKEEVEEQPLESGAVMDTINNPNIPTKDDIYPEDYDFWNGPEIKTKES